MTIEDAIIKTEALSKGEKELAEAGEAYVDPEHIEALDVLVAAAKGFLAAGKDS